MGLRRRGVRKEGRKGWKSFCPPSFKELPQLMHTDLCDELTVFRSTCDMLTVYVLLCGVVIHGESAACG